MSAASELREALSMVLFNAPYAEIASWEKKKISRALDAVIAALPEPMTEDGEYSYGFNKAMLETRSLLQSAKTQKGEE